MTSSEPAGTAPGRHDLRVAEARPQDVDRRLVRLDPGDMAALGVETGDIVAVSGRRTTVARAVPAYPDRRGQRLAQMDGLVRANAGVGVGDMVSLQRALATPARRVVLRPESGGRAAELDGRHLGRILQGIPVVQGDRVRVNLVGAEHRSFTVISTEPAAPVVLEAATVVRVEGSGSGTEAVTYEDIGGLKRELERVREVIELPLRHPQVFAHLGIEPPKGVLLYGPPGTGKTLIARAAAQEARVKYVHLNGPEIMDKWYGASEAHLRRAFEEAQAGAPAILFIDELDAIAASRAQMGGERQVERRVVAQLLALMDGLVGRGQVIVVAATNIPDTLDPALRRPGRFDREIEIGVPSEDGRREILEIHSRGMPLGEGVSLDALAAVAHGFVGADLAALCREAAMAALRRLIPEIQFGTSELAAEAVAGLKVERWDFEAALREVGPSALREIGMETPDTRWSDVGGLSEAKRQLQEAVLWPLRETELFQRFGTRPPRGVLLHGPPGTGKTLLAKAVAGESGVNFIPVRGPQLLSMWVGESERGVREVFRKARQAAPCIVLFDEIDALAPRRAAGGGDPAAERVVAQLLAELDGVQELSGVVVIATTNRLDRLDPAVIRAGRFDLMVELPPPDAAARADILAVHARPMPLDPEVSLDDLALATEGWTGADLAALCRHAALAAMRDVLDAGSALAAGEATVGGRHFQAARGGGRGGGRE